MSRGLAAVLQFHHCVIKFITEMAMNHSSAQFRATATQVFCGHCTLNEWAVLLRRQGRKWAAVLWVVPIKTSSHKNNTLKTINHGD